jgi:hypothetical protein
MSEDRQERNWNHSLLISVVLLMLPLLYFLSSGPAIYLMNRGYMSHDTFILIYRPIGWATKISWLDTVIQWYSHLWGA